MVYFLRTSQINKDNLIQIRVFKLTRIIYNNCLFLSMAGWISALISSIFGAGEEIEKILEEE